MEEPAHLAQAQHNEGFFGEVDPVNHSDWAVTALFYAAVHYVDAYLARKREHPASHDERRRCLRSYPATKAIFTHYERLARRSEAARYDAARFTQPELALLRTVDLATIKNSLG